MLLAYENFLGGSYRGGNVVSAHQRFLFLQPPTTDHPNTSFTTNSKSLKLYYAFIHRKYKKVYKKIKIRF